ncbi:hypothetical protein LX36DRAFT_661492 [Colletotrichum falcatum]|nr:hypothetical protein LX36DRAFT_661492 [Colletotrichum falcatum]
MGIVPAQLTSPTNQPNPSPNPSRLPMTVAALRCFASLDPQHATAKCRYSPAPRASRPRCPMQSHLTHGRTRILKYPAKLDRPCHDEI